MKKCENKFCRTFRTGVSTEQNELCNEADKGIIVPYCLPKQLNVAVYTITHVELYSFFGLDGYIYI